MDQTWDPRFTRPVVYPLHHSSHESNSIFGTVKPVLSSHSKEDKKVFQDR